MKPKVKIKFKIVNGTHYNTSNGLIHSVLTYQKENNGWNVISYPKGIGVN